MLINNNWRNTIELTITISKGHRHPDDIIINYNGKPISIYEIAEILLLLWKNEDKLHPSPELGAKMLLNFINEIFQTRQLSDELLRKYHISRKDI